MRRNAIRLIGAFLGAGLAMLSARAVEMPILGWHGIPCEKVTAERYRQAKDAGFTHLMQWAPDLKEVKRVLDDAEAAGIKLSIHSPCIEKGDIAGAVRAIKGHPALGLYHLRDEPVAKDLHAIGEIAKKIMAEDPAHPCYMNWCGVVGRDPQIWYGAPDYRAYIEISRREVPIQLISFDKYPLVTDYSKVGDVPYRDIVETTLKTNFYETLEIVRETSRREKVPFWAFALSTAHGIAGGTVYFPKGHAMPTATVAGMKLQQYSNLAYGAQGLQYFTYWLPGESNMKFHDAPVGLDGRTTFVMDRVRTVNAELQARARVFVGSDSRGVWHAGEKIPPYTRRIALDELPPAVRALDVRGEAVVSHHVNGADEYLMVLNRDLHRETTFNATFAAGARRIRTDGSEVAASAHSSEYVLSPGEAEIFLLPKGVRSRTPAYGSGLVVAADQAHGGAVVFDAARASRQVEFAWAWCASDSCGLNDAFRKECGTPNDVRIASTGKGGKGVLILYGQGTYVLVDMKTRKPVYGGCVNARNPQTIAALPEFGRVAIAAPLESSLIIAKADAGKFDATKCETARIPFKGVGGVVWDAKRNCLWAAGGARLVAYGWNGETLVERRTIDVKSTSGGAEVTDLSMAADGSVNLVTRSRIIRIDPEAEASELVREQFRTPCYSFCGDFGEVHTVVREKWWTDRALVRRGHVAYEVVSPGSRFYRIRWIEPKPETRKPIVLEGTTGDHLQGVTSDGKFIYWSTGALLVKTDLNGRRVASQKVDYHHGSPCVVDGVVYVALNRGKFNTTDRADNYVCAYRADDLSPAGRWKITEPRGGAGGITAANGRFFVVGGLHTGEKANRIAEYDEKFNLIGVHEMPGYTHLGFQTAAFAKGRFWFGSYADSAQGGRPDATYVCMPDFTKVARIDTHTAEGVFELNGKMYSGHQFNRAGGHGGIVRPIGFASKGK